MKRRDFLRGAVASAGAAAVPMPVLAKAAAQTTAKVVPFHYGWACVFAQMNNGITAADIQRVFKIPPHEAQGLMDRMLTRGVLQPAGLDGRSHATRAWEPWDKKQAAAKAEAERARAQSETEIKTGHRARQKFQKFMRHQKAQADFIEFCAA